MSPIRWDARSGLSRNILLAPDGEFARTGGRDRTGALLPGGRQNSPCPHDLKDSVRRVFAGPAAACAALPTPNFRRRMCLSASWASAARGFLVGSSLPCRWLRLISSSKGRCPDGRTPDPEILRIRIRPIQAVVVAPDWLFCSS